jgi:hypothetical protein
MCWTQVARAGAGAASLLRSWRGFGSCSAARRGRKRVLVEFDVVRRQGVIKRGRVVVQCAKADVPPRRSCSVSVARLPLDCPLDCPLVTSPTRSETDVAHAGVHAVSRGDGPAWQRAARPRTRTRTRASRAARGRADCCRKQAHGKGKRHGGV